MPGHIHTYTPSTNQWCRHGVLNGGSLALCRHTASLVGSQLYCLGGGMNCFGFGTTFSNPVQLDLAPLHQHPQQSLSQSQTLPAADAMSSVSQPTAVPGSNSRISRGKPDIKPDRDSAGAGTNCRQLPSGGPRRVHNAMDASEQPQLNMPSIEPADAPAAAQQGDVAAGRIAANGNQQEAGPVQMAFAVHKAHAKAAKDGLRALDWLDRSCKAQADTANLICLPITKAGGCHLASANQGGNAHHFAASLSDGHSALPQQQLLNASVQEQDQLSSNAQTEQQTCLTSGDVSIDVETAPQPHAQPRSRVNGKGKDVAVTPDQHVANLKHMLAVGNARLQPLGAVVPAKCGLGPAVKLRQQMQALLEEQVGRA